VRSAVHQGLLRLRAALLRGLHAQAALEGASCNAARVVAKAAHAAAVQGRFGLHYPVHNTPHMVETLGKKQLEKKRLGAQA